MGALATIKWEGRSGRKYQYFVYKLGTRFKEAPGNYVLARETGDLTFAPVYIGHTEDISRELDRETLVPDILERGATHVHVHANSRGEPARVAEEADLLSMWSPVCNQ